MCTPLHSTPPPPPTSHSPLHMPVVKKAKCNRNPPRMRRTCNECVHDHKAEAKAKQQQKQQQNETTKTKQKPKPRTAAQKIHQSQTSKAHQPRAQSPKPSACEKKTLLTSNSTYFICCMFFVVCADMCGYVMLTCPMTCPKSDRCKTNKCYKHGATKTQQNGYQMAACLNAQRQKISQNSQPSSKS